MARATSRLAVVALAVLSLVADPPASATETGATPEASARPPSLSADHLLEILATQAPDGVWFREIGWAETSLAIDGVALDNEQIATFLSDLERTPYLSEVYLVRIASVPHPGGAGQVKEFRVTATTSEPGAAEVTWTGWPAHLPPGKRDVFQPVKGSSGDGRDPDGTGETWSYPAERYTLIGIVTNLGEPVAMLLGPDGLGHIVRVGDAYGTDRAVVEAIDPEGIRVRVGSETRTLSLAESG